MWDIASVFVRACLLIVAVLLMLSTGCTTNQPQVKPRAIRISQAWELEPGDIVAGHRVAGGLGDISIELKGDPVYAPFDGQVELNRAGCVLFSSADVPAYLFRLCGLRRPNLGTLRAGEAIGTGDYLQFAALRKQPGGTWTLVEPARNILERTLKKP